MWLGHCMHECTPIVTIFLLQFTAPTITLLLYAALTIVIIGWVEMGGGGTSFERCSCARAVQRVVWR